MVENFSFTPSLIIKENVEIKRARELPLSGKILVGLGDYISNDTVIGKTELVGELMLLRVSKELGLEAQDIKNSYLVKVNDAVKVNDILVRKKGLFNFFNSEYKSKYKGTIEFISKETGTIGIRLEPKNFLLLSYIAGKVDACNDEKSVVIKTNASIIQGAFGIGGERVGSLEKISSLEDLEKKTLIGDKQLKGKALKGKIVFSDITPDIKFINGIISLGAVGLIVPSIFSKTLKEFLGYDIGVAVTGNENIPISIIITEGLGNIKFNYKASDILNKNIGRDVSINGTTQIRAGAIRPEIIIFETLKEIGDKLNKDKLNKKLNNKIDDKFDNTDASKEEIYAKGLRVGSKVRILKAPYFGLFGTIVEMPIKEIVFESGIVARGVIVLLNNGSKVVVPKANVEVF
ncbi:MAG: hypothetical protein ACOX3T_00335 [Bdellovibrionota bacterium]